LSSSLLHFFEWWCQPDTLDLSVELKQAKNGLLIMGSSRVRSFEFLVG
jgi:hypothetical protein